MAKLKKTKEAIVKKAGELGVEYEAKYKGCCQSTFMAIVDALRWGGLEVIPEDIEEKIYPGISLLTAGVCMTGEGSCGAVSGSVLAMGLAYGNPEDSGGVESEQRAGKRIQSTLLATYYQNYGSILCKDVMRKYFGKSWDLTSDEMTREFLNITDGCTIRQTAKWAAEIILDEFEKGNLKIKP
ncbi:C-GCAxxG-C-C family (seleno)protein [Chloroflexota bacterium]